MGAFEIKPPTMDQSIRLYRTGFADPLVRPDNINAVTSAAALNNTAGGIIATYDEGEGRLTSFVQPDADADSGRLAYITLVNPNGATFDDVDDRISPVDRSVLNELFAQLTGKYDKFIVESMNTMRQEKAQILPLFGDNYAAMFSGRQPITIGISGHLVCDYSKKTLSWYKAFVYAYEYFLRASRLAKFRVKVRVVFPDVNEFEGYILSMSESQSANDDMLIPWSFTLLATEKNPFKPYLPSGTSGSKSVDQKTTSMVPKPVDPNKTAPLNLLTSQTSQPFDFSRTFGSSTYTDALTGESKAFTRAQQDILNKVSVQTSSFPTAVTGTSIAPLEIGKVIQKNMFAESAQRWFQGNRITVDESAASALFKKSSSSGSSFSNYAYKQKAQSPGIQLSIAALNGVVSKFAKTPGLIDVTNQTIFGRRVKLYESL